MRLPLVCALMVPALLPPTSAAALEKAAVRFSGDDDWSSAGASCSVAYYNICTGWIWIWSGWEPKERVGVVFDACCSDALLVSTSFYVRTGAPGGYGFTGIYTIQEADEDGCPIDPPLVGGLFPQNQTGMVTFETQLPMPVPSRFLATVQFGTSPGSPITLASDHPGAGPTGPPACGTCYPTGRLPHSFRYGTPDSVLCPGSPLNVGLCSTELMFSASLNCTVASTSGRWDTIEGLYR